MRFVPFFQERKRDNIQNVIKIFTYIYVMMINDHDIYIYIYIYIIYIYIYTAIICLLFGA